MVIYVDLIFLLNVLINFIFLLIIEIVFKDKFSWLRILCASLLGGVMIIGIIFNAYVYHLFKMLGGLVLSLVAFKKTTIGKQIIKISLFYTLNFAFVGVLEAFQIKTLVLLCLALVVILIIVFIQNNKKFYIFLKQTSYDVSVEFHNCKLDVKAFMDTGNFSTSDTGIPIIYLSNKYFNCNLKVSEQIYIETLAGRELVNAYKPNAFYYFKNKQKIEKRVLIVFSDISQFDCLIGSMIFI